jgi:hypothetical protein
MRVKVEGTNFVKDMNTGALLLTSKNAILKMKPEKEWEIDYAAKMKR